MNAERNPDRSGKVSLTGEPSLEEAEKPIPRQDISPDKDGEILVAEPPKNARVETTAEIDSEFGTDQVFRDLTIKDGDLFAMYTRDIRKVPLLTAEEEIDLSKQIERGRKAHKALAESDYSETERCKLQALIEDGWAAHNHLVTANSRLVISVAGKYMGNGVPFLDLIQEGNIGLIRATKKFDYRKGYRFSTYATWWIRQAATRAIADQGRTIRIPVGMLDRIKRLNEISNQLEQKKGRKPKLEEIAEKMEIDPQTIAWMMKISSHPLSLEMPIEEGAELGDAIKDTKSLTPYQIAERNVRREEIEEILSTLTPREARIIRLRCGFDGGGEHTLKEVGEKFGLTRERIRQIEKMALRRLRHLLYAPALHGYLENY